MTTAARTTMHAKVSQQPKGAALEPDPAISRFLDAVWMERGLSQNTLAAYRADLTALGRWLAERKVAMVKTTRDDLLEFIAYRVDAGARPRSTARQLSSFRRFFRYLVREGSLAEDPTAQIAMPKIGRSLPRSLSEEEVESLLNAPATGDPLGNRDRAMLEVLYATGLRVSELVSLRYNQVNLNQGVLRVVGKGNRERLIPLGEESVRWLAEFVRGPRTATQRFGVGEGGIFDAPALRTDAGAVKLGELRRKAAAPGVQQKVDVVLAKIGDVARAMAP
jgi:integrase/recombinase XerD